MSEPSCLLCSVPHPTHFFLASKGACFALSFAGLRSVTYTPTQLSCNPVIPAKGLAPDTSETRLAHGSLPCCDA